LITLKPTLATGRTGSESGDTDQSVGTRPKSGHSDLGWQLDKADSQPELRSPVFQWPEFFRFYQSPRRPLN